jgi:hypothetical protein
MSTQQSLKRASAARRCNEKVVRSRGEGRSHTIEEFLRTDEFKVLLERLLRHPPTRGVGNPVGAEVSDLAALDSFGLPTREEEQR